MFIFAELIATRRGRSSLVTTAVGTEQQRDGLENDITVNMMGFDPESKEFTTRWSKNTALYENPYEGFGISSIDVKVNSSFVPEVNIEFVDIRGMAFANKGKNSPYAILFDFPPALYELTLKGYYGRSLTYDLHLVKYNVAFDANTGNYNISTQFIARTFAPLTDVLFKYVEIFPMTKLGTAELPIRTDYLNQQDNNDASDSNQPNSVQSNPKEPPKNTHQLIKTLEVLYDKIRRVKDDSEISEAYEKSLKEFTDSENLANQIINFRTKLETDLQNGATLAIIDEEVDEEADERYFRSIVDLSPYNSVIKSFETKDIQPNTDQRLFLLVNRSPENTTNTDSGNNRANRDKIIDRNLEEIRKSLLQAGRRIDDTIINSDTSNDIKPTVPATTSFSGITIQDVENNVSYLGLDVTVFYQKLYKFQAKKRDDVEGNKKELVDNINNIAVEELGWENGPTIYNVFKVLCDDIDTFFNTLRTSSKNGEIHHEQYRSQIITNNPTGGIKDRKIGSYPRYAKLQVINNISKQVRNIPDLKAFPNVPKFPEVNLVDDFISTFVEIIKREDVLNLKTQVDTGGNNIWIPVSPADSVLYNELGYDSPYVNLFGQQSDSVLNRIYEIVLNRFYIGSQYTYAYNFYQDKSWFIEKFGNESNQNNLIKYVAGAEAVNLLNSISEENILFALQDAAKLYKTNINGFYSELKQRNVSNFSQLNNGDTSEFLILTNGENIYRKRTNTNYTGIRILDSSTINELRIRKEGDSTTESNETTQIVDEYLNSQGGTIKRISDFFTGQETVDEFTGENISYFNDITLNDDFDTNYLLNEESFVDLWTSFLSEENNGVEYDERFKEILDADEDTVPATGYSRQAKAFIIASNIGNTLGLINNGSTIEKIWKRHMFPALNTLPKFVIIYMGGLVLYQSDEDFRNEINRFFSNQDIGSGADSIATSRNKIKNDAESTDVLSVNDKNQFLDEFEDFINDSDEFGKVKIDFIDMINFVLDEIENDDDLDKDDLYKEQLKGDYIAISNNLNERFGILNTSQLTFYAEESETEGFKPLSVITGGTTVGDVTISSQKIISKNNVYFQQFFKTIGENIESRLERVQNQDIDINSSIQDEDIRTQTYYSFKSITDKWLAGQNNSVNGFPFNRPTNAGRRASLIENFMFVDRAMNPIGDRCVIDVEPLLNMANDYNLNMFNVFSRLLAHNGFEFFPIQNFMRFKDGEWEDTFKIIESANQSVTPAFVCMYIGGTSTTLANDSSPFDDDGIESFDDLSDIPDFDKTENNNAPEIQNKANPESYGYNEVRAFRVRYAEQNQSFFKNIQIDSREFPETNESLAILSKIAGDESAASPAPKGQNLFNIYENRSYSASVEMLGNMMIQPTQYFQLENVPIFTGAYMIVNVAHNFKPNHATTNFSGVRMLKYPNPIVTDFATTLGIQSGNATDISGNLATDSEVNFGSKLAEDLPEQARYDSMFTLRLKPDGELDSE
jgi:hypothetical protein